MGHKGDGIRMAKKIGADLVGMEQILTGGKPIFVDWADDVEDDIREPGWLLNVNQHGQRFVDESLGYYLKHDIMDYQPEGLTFAIFDSSALTNLEEDHGWPIDVLEERIGDIGIAKADSLEELAVELGINPEGLVRTVENYNAYVHQGEDQEFFKDPDLLYAVEEPPFYGVQTVTAFVTLTAGGLRIDREARVLRPEGYPISGLYAAGETTGGVLGDIYPAGGAAITDAIVFGRAAGSNAADEALQ